MSDDPDQSRRHPRNLQGLLRFAVEATRSEDAPAAAANAPPPMDEERRRFLEHALASMTVNVVEQLERAASVLTAADAGEDDQLNALECILDYVDNIDNANDFCKIGGLTILLPCLTPSGTAHVEVRRQSAAVVAELAQNNPFCQQQLLEMDTLPMLLALCADPQTNAKGMRAISACIRGYEPAAAKFIEMGGLESSLTHFQASEQNETMRVQTLFMLRALCEEYKGVKEELIKLNAIDTISSCLRPLNEYNSTIEVALSTLLVLTDGGSSIASDVNAYALEQCHDPRLGLRNKLTGIVRIGDTMDDGEFLETIDYASCLLKRLFPTAATTTTRTSKKSDSTDGDSETDSQVDR